MVHKTLLSSAYELSGIETLGQFGSLDAPVSLGFLLRVCGDTKALSKGRRVHEYIVVSGQDRNTSLCSLIVHMYGKCGALQDLRTCFAQIHERSVICWNYMIGSISRHGLSEEALKLFAQMKQEGMIPDKATLVNVVSACAGQAALVEGKGVDACSRHGQLKADVVLETALINMYGFCCRLEDARGVFDTMEERDVISWNAMVAMYVMQKDGKTAMQLFVQMQLEGVTQDKYTYVSMLSAAAILTVLETGKQIHARLVCHGFESDSVVVLALVNMYGKCESIGNAQLIFDKMCGEDVSLWNAMIAGYAHNEHGREAIELFDRLQQEGILPDKVTFVGALSGCASQAALKQARQMHVRIMASPVKSDMVLQTAVIHMYGKCGKPDDARRTFDKMPKWDRISLNAMIVVCVQHGLIKDALHLFCQMQWEGLFPNKVTIATVLSGFTSPKMLPAGKRIHASMANSGVKSDVVVGNALINMYGKCRSLDHAQSCFETMIERDAISWNTMIAAYAQAGHTRFALQLFAQRCWEGMIQDQASIVSILAACANWVCGYESYKCMRVPSSTVAVASLGLGSAFVNVDADCDSIKDVQGMSRKVPEVNVASVTGAKLSDVEKCHAKNSLQLFVQKQQEEVIANKATFHSSQSAHAGQKEKLAEGKLMHSFIMCSDCESGVVVANALLNFYGKCCSLKDALSVFNKMSERDVLSWNAMIVTYAQQGNGKEALKIFEQMQLEGAIPDNVTILSILNACAGLAFLTEGKQIHARVRNKGCDPDVIVGTALIMMYGKCGSLEDARMIFDELPEQDVVSWTSMIAAYAQHGYSKEALQLFDLMHWEGVIPDMVTFITLLDACTSQVALTEGRRVHTYITSSHSELDVALETALVNLYGKCGSLEDADTMFDRIYHQNLASWNAIISSYAQHGHGREALGLFHEMQKQGVAPDHVTFVSILCACSRAGLVNEGHHYLLAMSRDHGVAPNVEHYDCMIDLLGRVGRLDEADVLIRNMPFEPTIFSWATLLGACINQVDVGRAGRVANRLLELDPQDSVSYVSLSNIYAAAGRVDGGGRVIGGTKGQVLRPCSL